MCASHPGLETASTLTRGVAEPEAATETATVVVVDDEPDIAALAGAYLKRLETEVTVLVETDPADALERFETGSIDCVVSDYHMPEMHGLDLLAAVRERDSDVPFVLFTATADERVARRTRERDASYLRKEGDAGGFDRLCERVAAALDERGN